MNIINLTPNPSGGYPPIQTWGGAIPPDGYAEVSCGTTEFYAYRGFVTLTLTDGVVTGFSGNQVALDAYLAEYPDPVPDITPTAEEDRDAMLVDHEFRLTLIELGV